MGRVKRDLEIEFSQTETEYVIVTDTPLVWDLLEDALCWVAHTSPLKVFFWANSLWEWASQGAYRRSVDVVKIPIDCGSCLASKLWPSEDAYECEEHPKEKS